MTVQLNPDTLHAGKNSISFKSQGYELSANLFLPEDFDPAKRYPAILFASPGLSVKEQSGGVYGPLLAKKGYAMLVFDRLGFGESPGPFKRCLNPGLTDESYADAVSFLRAQPFVDRERFYAIGLCVGSIDLTRLAFADKRIKALCTVSGIVATHDGFYAQPREAVVASLLAANEARQAHYESGEMAYEESIPEPQAVQDLHPESTARQGSEYYKGLAGNSFYPRYSSMSPANFAEILPYYSVLSTAPQFYTPFLGIAGTKADTLRQTKQYFELCSEPKEMHVIEDATHVDLYHKEPYVEQAVERMDLFFRKYGGAGEKAAGTEKSC